MAMLMREPELGLNTENKRLPRGGRQLSYCSVSYCCGCGCGGCGKEVLVRQRREEDSKIEKDSNLVNLFDAFAEMTVPISSDLALFLYCMLN